MSIRGNKRQCESSLETSNIAYWTIRMMHDNPILPLVRNPYQLLHAAGLKKGQRVFEVGCGPGFFSIPAAKIVGDTGHVYTVDIHPRAVERVREKTEKGALKNLTPMCINASNTDLPGGSIDLAFVFGLRYIAGGMENVISELYRILKPGGILSIEKTGGSEAKWIEEIERKGFAYTEKQGRIFIFKKKGE